MEDSFFNLVYNIIIALASISGAFLASSNNNRSRFWGYFIWLFSNGAIAIEFWYQHNYPMVITFVIYECFNLRGCWNNKTS